MSFPGFGPGHLLSGEPASTYVEASKPRGLKARVRLEAPRRPGVYGMLDERGELIYVGKAKCLRKRLLSYFRSRGRGRRASNIIRKARGVAWELAATEFAALLRELELIARWQPRFNVQGQPRRRRRTFVCLGRAPAPHVFLTARPPRNVEALFGPLLLSERATEAVRHVNQLFRLRDCPQTQPMIFADENDLFPVIRTAGCLRHELGTCLAPCAAACTAAAYRQEVTRARAFLAGEDTSTLTQLERTMREAAAGQQFERAAAMRDRLESLTWLHVHLTRLRRARALSAVYPLQAADGSQLWYLIRRGQVRGVVPAPRTAADRAQARQTISTLIAPLPLSHAEVNEWIDGVLLVAHWFRKHPSERDRLMTVEQALRYCERPQRV